MKALRVRKTGVIAASTRIISNACIAYGTVETFRSYDSSGLASFTYNGAKNTALFTVKSFLIDGIPWHKDFLNYVALVGMWIYLEDLRYCEEKSSYLALGSVFVSSADCERDLKCATALATGIGRNQLSGVISDVAKNNYDKSYPLVVFATIGGRTENVFVGEDSVSLNGVPLREYRSVFLADYFEVGGPVMLCNLQRCEKKAVDCGSRFMFCTYSGLVDRIDTNVCFADMFRMHLKITGTQSVEVFDT